MTALAPSLGSDYKLVLHGVLGCALEIPMWHRSLTFASGWLEKFTFFHVRAPYIIYSKTTACLYNELNSPVKWLQNCTCDQPKFLTRLQVSSLQVWHVPHLVCNWFQIDCLSKLLYMTSSTTCCHGVTWNVTWIQFPKWNVLDTETYHCRKKLGFYNNHYQLVTSFMALF